MDEVELALSFTTETVRESVRKALARGETPEVVRRVAAYTLVDALADPSGQAAAGIHNEVQSDIFVAMDAHYGKGDLSLYRLMTGT